jgi:hypothetical protein
MRSAAGSAENRAESSLRRKRKEITKTHVHLFTDIHVIDVLLSHDIHMLDELE